MKTKQTIKTLRSYTLAQWLVRRAALAEDIHQKWTEQYNASEHARKQAPHFSVERRAHHERRLCINEFLYDLRRLMGAPKDKGNARLIALAPNYHAATARLLSDWAAGRNLSQSVQMLAVVQAKAEGARMTTPTPAPSQTNLVEALKDSATYFLAPFFKSPAMRDKIIEDIVARAERQALSGGKDT